MNIGFSIAKNGMTLDAKELKGLEDVDKLLAGLQELGLQANTTLSTEMDKQLAVKDQSKVKKNAKKKKDSDESNSSEEEEED